MQWENHYFQILALEMHNRNSTELRRLIADRNQLGMKKVDFEKIRESLNRVVVAFAELRKQFATLVQFFQKTRNIIDVCLNKSVNKLVDEVEVSAERSKFAAG